MVLFLYYQSLCFEELMILWGNDFTLFWRLTQEIIFEWKFECWIGRLFFEWKFWIFRIPLIPRIWRVGLLKWKIIVVKLYPIPHFIFFSLHLPKYRKRGFIPRNNSFDIELSFVRVNNASLLWLHDKMQYHLPHKCKKLC